MGSIRSLFFPNLRSSARSVDPAFALPLGVSAAPRLTQPEPRLGRFLCNSWTVPAFKQDESQNDPLAIFLRSRSAQEPTAGRRAHFRRRCTTAHRSQQARSYVASPSSSVRIFHAHNFGGGYGFTIVRRRFLSGVGRSIFT